MVTLKGSRESFLMKVILEPVLEGCVRVKSLTLSGVGRYSLSGSMSSRSKFDCMCVWEWGGLRDRKAASSVRYY